MYILMGRLKLKRMASIQEKLADSLSVLKKYQDENNSDIIQGMKTLGETHMVT